MNQYFRFYCNAICVAVMQESGHQSRNVVYRDYSNGTYGEWTIKNVTLTTNGEFRCMAVNKKAHMWLPISGQFIIMPLVVMAAIMAAHTR